MIVVFALSTSHSASIVRPCCSECGTATFLVGIEAERPGYDLHTSSALSASNLKPLVCLRSNGLGRLRKPARFEVRHRVSRVAE